MRSSNKAKEDVDERVVADMDWMAQQQHQQSTASTPPPLVALSFAAINSSNISLVDSFGSRANDCSQPHTSEQQECLATYRNNLCNLYKGLLTQLNTTPKGHHADNQRTSHSITP